MMPTDLEGRRNGTSGHDPLLRTLPLRTTPLPGEALDSWLQTVARHSGATWGDIATSTGYQSAGITGARRPIATLNAEQLAALTYTTGVAPQTLWEMTPASLLPVPYATTAVRTLLVPGSRFCPRCLRDNSGRWPLWWRLRWAFACPTHQSLLADYCPSCRRRQRIEAPPMDFVPQPGRCDRPALGGRGRPTPSRCGALLSDAITADVPADSAVLSAQRRILEVIAAAVASGGIYGDGAVSALTYVTDLHVLGERLLPSPSSGSLSPEVLAPCATSTSAVNADTTRSAIVALSASLAVAILNCDRPEKAAELLRARISPDGIRPIAHRLRGTPGASAELSRVGLYFSAGPVDQLRGLTRRQPVEQGSSSRQRGIPALLWPAVAYRFVVSDLGFERLRHALSVAVSLTNSSIGLEEACAHLGNTYPPRSVTRALQHLHTQPWWPACVDTLARLADDIDRTPPPIDYTRRRTLAYKKLIPDDAWHDMCWQQGILAGSGVKVRLYRCWLFERLTCSPARHCLHAINSPKFASALAVLPRELTPDVVAALVRVGRMFLDAQGLHREPVSWQPSLPAAVGGPVRWDAASIARLHRMIVTEGLSMTVAAGALNTTAGVIRSILSDHPPPRDNVGCTGTDRTPPMFRARRALPCDVLEKLYDSQGLSLAQIAARTQVSRSAVAALAHEYGLTLRPAHRRPRSHASTPAPL